MTPRLGLALSGGGARGAFTVGVVRYLAVTKQIRDFPVISGTSTGALVGSLACTQQWADLKKLYTHSKPENIINPNHPLAQKLLGEMGGLLVAALTGGQAVFNTTALQQMIDVHVDFDGIKQREPDSHLIYSTVNLRTGQIVRFDNARNTKAQLKKGLLASASEPVFMDPVEIQREGKKDVYTDGGIRDLIPLTAIFDAMADRNITLDGIVVISTKPLDAKADNRKEWKIVDIMSRAFELFLVEVGQGDYQGAVRTNAALRLIQNARASGMTDAAIFRGMDAKTKKWLKSRKPVPVCFVGPKKHLEHSSLDFDQDKMKAMMKMGRERAREVLPAFLAKLP